MWSIESLHLDLPPGFEHRAAEIATRLTRELESFAVPGNIHLETLRLPPLEIHPAASDWEIAWRLAKAVAAAVR